MQAEQKRKQNEQNLIDALSFREPDKVPVGMEAIQWPFAYAGVTYKEVMNDPERAAEAHSKFLNDIELDFMWAPPGVSKPIQAFWELGSMNYVLGPDDTTIAHAQTNEMPMDASDYDVFMENPGEYMRETLLRKRVPAFQKNKKEAYESLLRALQAYKPTVQMNDLIMKDFLGRGIIHLTSDGPQYAVPLDTLFDQVRGMKNTLLDLRRQPKKIAEICDKIFEENMAMLPKKPSDYEGKDGLFCGVTVYHSACFLNMKQFDAMFMHYLKEGFMDYFNAGVHMFLKGEGKFMHTLNRFRDLPKGAMVIMLEEDDPFEAYKEIGDWQVLATGIRADLLKYGTKEKCIDYVKKCYDTFAPGGGFVFLQDRPLMSAKDANIDNVLAVYEFANEYGKKK